ncbi:MAG: gamma-glutamyltransferase [Gammaproteobacteria bacterium]|nr:gamma-glutamyltransferase [Gammaproteobacteria bacterium]
MKPRHPQARRWPRHVPFAALCLVFLASLPGVQAAQAPARPGKAAIAAAHPLAVAAGEEVLAAGGNAFDAAVAVSAALAVVEPYASGLGGGGFWLLHVADGQRDVFIDGREVAPGAATATMYLDARGEVIKGASISGPLAAGIPGEPAALAHIAEHYGRLPLARSLAPAIRLAGEGIPVHERLQMGLRFRRPAMEASPALLEVFYPGGKPPAAGSLLRQPDLATTLHRLGREGFDGFYRGPTAAALVEGVRAAGGIWSLEDLAGYRVLEREPVRGDYRGLRLTSAPLPSAGGIGLVNMLNILAGYRLEQLEPAVRKHLLIEAMRRAYRDRSLYLGDPAFSRPPVEQLLSPFYAAGQRVSIRLDRATPSEVLAPGAAGGGTGSDTTHFSILDAEGNRVAGTLSINTWYGAAFMPPGTGVLLNNEMDDFTIKPGVANAYELLGAAANNIAPGKRMLSSMTPSFLESERGVAILGTPGGSRIITMVLLATLDWADGGDAHSMVALRRFHHQFHPDVVEYEVGAFSEAEVAALEALGHRLELGTRGYGNMNVVTWDYATGKVDAASDPRSAGEAQVY